MTVTNVHVSWAGESLTWDLRVDVEVDPTRTVQLYGSIPTLAQVTEGVNALIRNWRGRERPDPESN